MQRPFELRSSAGGRTRVLAAHRLSLNSRPRRLVWTTLEDCERPDWQGREQGFRREKVNSSQG